MWGGVDVSEGRQACARSLAHARATAAAPRVAIGFQLENDYSCRVTRGCHFGSFVTERKSESRNAAFLLSSRCHAQKVPRARKRTHPFSRHFTFLSF